MVGGGPAGVTAAIQARQLGAAVTLLEADQVGGTNLNRGPAPVRTMARSARLARDWTSWSVFGLEGPPPKPNLKAILANSDRVARHAFEKKHLADQLRRHGIDLVEHLGPVQFTDPHTLTAGDGRAGAPSASSWPSVDTPAGCPSPGSELALTYSDIRTLTALPAAAAIVGAADTGCQIASILADLGSRVSLFEAGPTIVPHADLSISTELERAFQRKGIETHTNTMVTAPTTASKTGSSSSTPPPPSGRNRRGRRVLRRRMAPQHRATGARRRRHQRPNRQGIPVDAYLRTEVDHIFAAGDVNGRSMLVQVARLEGRVAAQNALMGPTRQVSYDVVPSASFTDPEYGGVGLTEPAAARHHDIVVGVAHYDDLLRPVADGREEGFCKLIADRHRQNHPRRPRAGRVLRRNHPGRRRLHDGRHDRRTSR